MSSEPLEMDSKMDASSSVSVPVKSAADDSQYIEQVMKRYDVFAIGPEAESGLTVRQVFVILNLNAPIERRVSYWTLQAAFDRIDKQARKGALDRDGVKRLIVELSTADKDDKSQLPKGAVGFFVFLLLLFYPVLMLLAVPINIAPGLQTLPRAVLRSFLRVISMPPAVRDSICDKFIPFFIFHFLMTGFYAITIAATIIGVALNFEYQGARVSFLEPVIPAFGLIGMCIMNAIFFSLDDYSAFEAQEKALDGGRLHNINAVCENPNTNTGEEILARLFYESAETRKFNRIIRSVGSLGAIVIAAVFAALPFFIRIYLKYNAIGTCEKTNECAERDDAFIAVAIIGAMMTFFVAWYYIDALFGTFEILVERRTIFSRLSTMLKQKDGKTGEKQRSSAVSVPYLNMKHGDNLIVWSKLRIYALNYKASLVARIEVLVGLLTFFVLLLLAAVLANRLVGFGQRINEAAVYVDTGFLLGIMGVYIVYPILFNGVSINAFQDYFVTFFADEKWRLVLLAETTQDPENHAYYTRAAALSSGLYELLTNVDTQFRVFGFAVNSAFLGSVATTVGAAVAGWLSEL